jgi:hypothetical protein
MYTKPEDILLFRRLTQKASLELEIKGLRKKGRTMYSMIKQEYNLRGSRENVLEQFGNFIKENRL